MARVLLYFISTIHYNFTVSIYLMLTEKQYEEIACLLKRMKLIFHWLLT